MRILLVAYDFSPLNSPQAIRWYYLSRELVRLGVDMHVLAPDLRADRNGLTVPPGVTVHRCDAGGLAGWLVRRQQARRQPSSSPQSPVANATPVGSITLNWKGRLHQRLERCVSRWVYPDSRGQWRASASAVLEVLIDTIRPDVLISSHEPAVTLQLGLQVAGRVPAWLADFGDPVLAGYTPRRWRRRAGELEAAVCRVASGVSVTTMATQELLRARHVRDASKIFVLSQGFDDSLPRATASTSRGRSGELHLLYTGRFYPFRNPRALFEAVLALPQIRLTIAAPEVKAEYLVYATRSGGRIAFLGEQPHAKVLELQQDCDVLVNIGNAMNVQIPGKLFEYLGSGKPILHLYYADDDPVNTLLAAWRRGWACCNERASLQAFLGRLAQFPEELNEATAGDIRVIARYGWSYLARELLDHCMKMRVTA